MHRAWLILTAIALPAIALPASAAEIVSLAPDAVEVTIYRDPEGDLYEMDDEIDYEAFDYETFTGLAMVTETRTVEVPAGVSTLVFRDVADAIVPQTAAIDGLPTLVLESNFDYDLLSPGAIIAKSLGSSVRLVRVDESTGRVTEHRAILHSGPDGVVLEMDGTFEALDCSGLAEKLVFDSIPEGLADQPTLSMKVQAAQAGRHTFQLSYLALGLNWNADYVATIAADGRTLDLTGWITLVNLSATTFANAPTEVVAGELARTPYDTLPPGPAQVNKRAHCWPVGQFASRLLDRMSAQDVGAFPRDAVLPAPLQRVGGEEEIVVTGIRASIAKMSELGDYKLYSLPSPTTVAARQSKQVVFLHETKIPFERLYTYRLNTYEMDDLDGETQSPNVTLRLQNKERDGLGKPLPAGTIAVLEPGEHGAGVMLAGEDTVQDIPVGLPVEIEVGRAMDIRIEPKIIDDETLHSRRGRERQAKIEVRFGNDKPVPVVIEYRQSAEEGVRVIAESKRHTMKSGDPMWTFRLRPGRRAVLTYTIRAPD